jgi:hypothetical protein
MPVPVVSRCEYFDNEQRPPKPDISDFNDGPRDNHRELVAGRSCIRHVAANSWRGLNWGGHFAQAANAVGNFRRLSAGLGTIAGGMQLEVDHEHNERHAGGNLHGDGECHIWLGNQNDGSPIHGAVRKKNPKVRHGDKLRIHPILAYPVAS